jgi:hypothetical protein
MKNGIFVVIVILFYIGCEDKSTTQQIKVKSKEEILLERQERKKIREQMFIERKEQYKEFLSINRVSGDIKGIWYVNYEDNNNIKDFLNENIVHSMGYCIEVSKDQKNAKIFFAVTNKVFNVQIEKHSDTKYSMLYGSKRRFFEVINCENKISKNKFSLKIFFENSNKYNPSLGSSQAYDGINFYDYCTSGINDYDCTVEGCLQDIKERDEYNKAEREAGPLGIEDEVDSNVKN